MVGKMSNRDRIARRALEAEAIQAEKKAAAPRTTKKVAAKKVAAKPPGRTRVVWVVCDRTGSEVKTYPYPEEREARAEVERLTTETGKAHFVTRGEVPFE